MSEGQVWGVSEWCEGERRSVSGVRGEGSVSGMRGRGQ